VHPVHRVDRGHAREPDGAPFLELGFFLHLFVVARAAEI
jgi:hypothetical protein